MIDEADPRIPNPATIWQLWHSDTFDRDSSPSLQGNGVNILHGLFELWLYTLKEGIMENGSASFSYFYLTWADTATTRVDVAVNPFHNPALLKLRRWAGFTTQAQEIEDGGNSIILRLAQLHFDRLLKSSRWRESSIDWSEEAREVLARVELISSPKEL